MALVLYWWFVKRRPEREKEWEWEKAHTKCGRQTAKQEKRTKVIIRCFRWNMRMNFAINRHGHNPWHAASNWPLTICKIVHTCTYYFDLNCINIMSFHFRTGCNYIDRIFATLFFHSFLLVPLRERWPFSLDARILPFIIPLKVNEPRN